MLVPAWTRPPPHYSASFAEPPFPFSPFIPLTPPEKMHSALLKVESPKSTGVPELNFFLGVAEGASNNLELRAHEIERARAVTTAELDAALAALRHGADPAPSPEGHRRDARRRNVVGSGGAPRGEAGAAGSGGSTTRAQAMDLEEAHRAVGIPDPAIGPVIGALTGAWVEKPGDPRRYQENPKAPLEVVLGALPRSELAYAAEDLRQC